MLTFSDTWADLFGLAGFLNPLAIIIGAGLGWHADQLSKAWIAGFAAAAISLILETAWGFTGLPGISSHDAGALAMFPFRFVIGALMACLTYWLHRRIRN